MFDSRDTGRSVPWGRAAAFAGLVCLGAAECLAAKPGDFIDRPPAWFAGDEAARVADTILSFQAETGGWPKNVSTVDAPFSGDRSRLRATYDNGATIDELRFLAGMVAATGHDRFRAAFDRGLQHVLEGQYATGGWPQFHPPGSGYHRHITFNDNAMVRIMQWLREVAGDDRYRFVDDAVRRRAAEAFDRGVACILACQIVIDGRRTAWCAQHDEIDLRPRPARSYELATLSGFESVGITRLLMSIDEPTPEVRAAVAGAVAWFERSALTGIRIDSVRDPRAPRGFDRVVVEDPTAGPLWARFYTLDTNQPVFADRDGVPRPRLADIGVERRTGYAWYGDQPRKLLEVEAARWRRRHAPP